MLTAVLVSLFWSIYLTSRFSRLPSIRLWEIVALVGVSVVPLFALLLHLQLTVSPFILVSGVVLIVFLIIKMRRVRYGATHYDGFMRVLKFCQRKPVSVANVADLDHVDVLVLSKGQMATLSQKKQGDIINLVQGARRLNIRVISISTYLQQHYGYLPVDREMARNLDRNSPPIYRFIKRANDLIIGCLVLLIVAPLMLVTALTILAFQGRPILYRQERISRGGKKFKIFKFRTMEENGAGKNTTTRLGTVLRLTHIDELPQLFNIILGDMSFIGPRPEWLLLTKPGTAPSNYWLRQEVKPGLTGWAQVNYKPSRTLSMRRRKLGYDLYYIRNRSAFLDMLIILRTALKLPVFYISLLVKRRRRLSA